MFASFRVVSGDRRLMPAVPQDAAAYDGAQARVWVALPEQKTVTGRVIEVGDTVNGLVEVRKGLSLGESVVSSGAPSSSTAMRGAVRRPCLQNRDRPTVTCLRTCD